MFVHCKCKCGYDQHHTANNPLDERSFLSHDAFHSLSEEEKNRVFGDIYGVGADVVEETPEMIEEKIHQVTRAMDKIPKSKKLGYLTALDEENKQGTHYVHSTKLLLMFLRAARFHVPSAAKRIARHFDNKLELFGASLLPRGITQDDLTADDKEVLYSGYMYINNNMDHFGRTIIFLNYSRIKFQNVTSFFRMLFYYGLAALEDNEHAQKIGIVMIMYMIDIAATEWQTKQVVKTLRESSFIGSTPYRIASLHVCEAAMTNFNVFHQLVLTLYSMTIKARYRQHNGSHSELRSELLKFGIRVELLPILSDGKFDEYTYMQPIRKRLQQEHYRQQARSATGGDDHHIVTVNSCDDCDDMSLGSY